jgi:hypothetical protein
MDFFLGNVLSINEEIDTLVSPNDLINTSLKHKQYLVYYLYRVVCRYSNIIKKIVSLDMINTIYYTLDIPVTEGCYAMANRMPNNIERLDLALLNIIELMNTYNKRKDSLTLDVIEPLETFLKEKNNVSIIRDDIINLSRLIPNLSKPEII